MTDIIRIDAHTWRMEDGGVRFFLLEGEERALLIDSGMNAPDARETAEGLTSLPLALLNTHADPDHISGNGAFSEFYMSPAEEGNLRAHGGSGKIVPVSEGDEIELGGRLLRIFDLPGHTPGSIAVLDVSARILYGGDAIQDGAIFLFGERRDLPRYADSLQALWDRLRDEFDLIHPSHGTIPLEKERIPALIEAAHAILSGTSEGEAVSFKGKAITVHTFPCASFLCDGPAQEVR